MMPEATQTRKPVPGILIGITHNADLAPVIREVRVLKVGIGISKGKACYVYTHQGRWIVRYGAGEGKDFKMATAKGSDGKPGFPNRKEAEDWYRVNKNSFAASRYPQKIPFFTFTRRTVNDKGEELFEPDFAAIEAHGDTPREIDIVFMGDNPLFAEYQAWSATELKCHGDGLNALRVISLGNDQWPGWKEASDAKQKFFPVEECSVSGLCPYAQEGGKDKLVCKPMTTLSFQLAKSIRLGATAYFTTTGIRSAKNLFSSLEIIRSIAEHVGSGITNTPLKLVLAPFKTNLGIQYGVSLELRTQDVQTLRALLMESAWKPQAETRRMLSPAEEPDLTPGEVTAEWMPEAVPDMEDEQPEPASTAQASTAQAETEKKTDSLAEKLKAERERKEAAPAAPAPAAAAPAAAPAAAAPEATPLPTIPEADLKWQQRCKESFLEKLGAIEFVAVMHGVTGSEDIASITAHNYVDVWKAMEKAAKRLPQPAPAPTVDPPPPKDGALF